MLIDKEKIYSITNEEIECLIDYIGINILKKNFIDTAKVLDISSKYYIGKKTFGKFWNGFRPESISIEKIKKVYLQEYKKQNSELNISEMLNCNIMQKESAENVQDLKERLSMIGNADVIGLLCKLYDIDFPNAFQVFSREKLKLEADYEKKIQRIITEFEENQKEKERKFDKKLQTVEKQKQDMLKEKKELKEKVILLVKDIENMKIHQKGNDEKLQEYYSTRINDKIQSIINYNISIDQFQEISMNKSYNINDLNDIIENMLKDNLIKYEKKEKIKDDLIKEYILISMMEE